ncbi:hypothetical protein [Singulisphaera acidiphila]|uniref:Lipoprotein n=1 Tax=Singulisphaera acidiphila (strain ATCC BAA-1392 / DSM 18658 / VKM B-2454 / MOB10) TaxID=886293 RepID=L0D624_SINAD|nr:hypothetical protein [Singulisphaera acidiphila]AGA24854.1 hypothetical protein Sinac_0415 [Singulisphaera acidiphila DSM 18658]
MRTMMFVVTLCVTFGGCGGSGSQPGASGPASALEVGPHGGILIPLPEEKGFAEVALESPPGAAKRSSKPMLVARFLRPDLKSALEPPPGEVSIKLEFPDRAAETISLKPVTEANSRNDPGRFASAPGDYAVDPLIGELKATLQGQAFAAPFTNGR